MTGIRSSTAEVTLTGAEPIARREKQEMSLVVGLFSFARSIGVLALGEPCPGAANEVLSKNSKQGSLLGEVFMPVAPAVISQPSLYPAGSSRLPELSYFLG